MYGTTTPTERTAYETPHTDGTGYTARQIDPGAVQVTECTVQPNTATPTDAVTVQATVENRNTVGVLFDVGWFAADVPNGPGVAVVDTQGVPANSETSVATTITPGRVTELPESFSSTIQAQVLPGSVRRPPGARDGGDRGGAIGGRQPYEATHPVQATNTFQSGPQIGAYMTCGTCGHAPLRQQQAGRGGVRAMQQDCGTLTVQPTGDGQPQPGPGPQPGGGANLGLIIAAILVVAGAAFALR